MKRISAAVSTGHLRVDNPKRDEETWPHAGDVGMCAGKSVHQFRVGERAWEHQTSASGIATQRLFPAHNSKLISGDFCYDNYAMPMTTRHTIDAISTSAANPHLSVAHRLLCVYSFLEKEDIIADQAQDPPHGSFLRCIRMRSCASMCRRAR